MPRPMSQNLSLWEEEPASVSGGVARLNWSYSRRESLDQCPRRYFYQYYTACTTDLDLREQLKVSVRESPERASDEAYPVRFGVL